MKCTFRNVSRDCTGDNLRIHCQLICGVGGNSFVWIIVGNMLFVAGYALRNSKLWVKKKRNLYNWFDCKLDCYRSANSTVAAMHGPLSAVASRSILDSLRLRISELAYFWTCICSYRKCPRFELLFVHFVGTHHRHDRSRLYSTRALFSVFGMFVLSPWMAKDSA